MLNEEPCDLCELPAVMTLDHGTLARFCEEHRQKFVRANEKRRGVILRIVAGLRAHRSTLATIPENPLGAQRKVAGRSPLSVEGVNTK